MATNFDTLLEELRVNPELALTVDLDNDEMLALQQKLDPYARIAGPDRNVERPRVVVASYTNLREAYIRRFTMTGMVAFVFRMLEEWSVPAESRRWKPAKVKGERKPFTTEDLVNRADALKDLAGLVQEAEKAYKEACEAAQKFNKDEMVFSEKQMRETAEAMKAKPEEGKTNPVYQKMQQLDVLMNAAKESEDKLWGVRYMATLEMRNMGIEADLRIPETEKEAMKHPQSRQVIQSEPNRYKGMLPGGQNEMPEKLAKGIIRGFLANYFEYDPDAHVRKAYDEMVIKAERRDIAGLPDKVLVDPTDPERLPLTVLLTEAPPETTVETDTEQLKAMIQSKSELEQQHAYNVLCHLLTNSNTAKIAAYVLSGAGDDPDRQERWRRMLLPKIAKDKIPAVPPQDTFHRFNYYLEVNMEALRAATASIYHDKPELDFAIAVMDSFEGTREEVQKFGEKFRDDHQDQVISEIKLIEMGGWTFLGDFEKNREKANFFNRQTDVLERILKRHEEDQKFGGLLMRQRVRTAKAKNIKEEGPDAPGLSEYKASRPVPGAREVLTPAEKRRLERTKGDLKAARELEYYEQYEKIAKDLEAQSKLRELTSDEQRTLKNALEEMEKAQEMLAVPEDAIQVDVWTTSHKEGTTKKSKFYTKATNLGENKEDADLTQANVARAAAVKKANEELKKAQKGESQKGESQKEKLEKVVAFYPEASQAMAREALSKGETPKLAPFAQDFLSQEMERESEARKVEEDATAQAMGMAADGKGQPTPGPADPLESLASAIDAALDDVDAKKGGGSEEQK